MRHREAGFTYLGLIIFVFIIGLVGAATLKIGSLLQRAHLETELLETGAQFGIALKTYAEATPRGQPTQPPSLQELLRDTRFPNPRRHLRKIFVDPATGRAEWGLVRVGEGEGGRILGVYSLSQATPLKQANFDARFPGFENRQHLSEWKFMAAEGASAPASVQPRAPRPGIQPPGAPVPAPPGTVPPAQPEPQPEAPTQEPPQPEPEPEAPPAPTMVCSSSMNRITSGDFSSSFITAFMRSSN